MSDKWHFDPNMDYTSEEYNEEDNYGSKKGFQPIKKNNKKRFHENDEYSMKSKKKYKSFKRK